MRCQFCKAFHANWVLLLISRASLLVKRCLPVNVPCPSTRRLLHLLRRYELVVVLICDAKQTAQSALREGSMLPLNVSTCLASLTALTLKIRPLWISPHHRQRPPRPAIDPGCAYFRGYPPNSWLVSGT